MIFLHQWLLTIQDVDEQGPYQFLTLTLDSCDDINRVVNGLEYVLPTGTRVIKADQISKMSKNPYDD